MKALDNKHIRDQRGAMMIIGVFMAFGLVGTLWFLLGIGASIVGKEKLQQAADAVAFSGAAVHARDMNFVVAINLVMFMLAALWLLLCVTYTVMQIVAVYTWLVGIVSCIVGCEALPDAAEMEEIKEEVGEIKDTYHQLLESTLPELSGAQDVIALGADLEAVGLTALAVASNDKVVGGGASIDLPNPEFTGQTGVRIGLPIESEKNSALCNHAANWVMGYVQTLLEKNPLVKKLMNMSTIEKLALKVAFSKYISSSPFAGMTFDKFEDLLTDVRKWSATALTDLYCSGDVWDRSGPKRMWRPDQNEPAVMEKNASDWMQIYGVVKPFSLDDNDAEHKIGIASRSYKTHTDPNQLTFFGYAQAEYFFDCQGKWDSGDCNSISDEVKDAGIDAAMYRMEWRARLVRVHTPKNMPGAGVANALGDLLRSRATAKRLEDSGTFAPEYRAAFAQIPNSVLDFINDLPAANFH
jgi:hypothetical protein